jgi:DeoR/GlpR family transcriptional regulator of sugar metabolism
MFKEERIQKILLELLDKKSINCKYLASKYSVSIATIYNDLNSLCKRGYIKRTHGGAIADNQYIYHGSIIEELPLHMRKNEKEKAAIGKAAASLIEDDDTIVIDGGITNLYVFRNLKNKKNLTIITNSSIILSEISSNYGANIISTGGLLRKESLAFVGEITESTLSKIRPNKAILGIEGISIEQGLTTINFMESSVKKKIISISKNLILVADSSKLNKTSLIPIAPIEKINYLVTDEKAPEDFINKLREYGITVITAYLGNSEIDNYSNLDVQKND